MGPNSGALQKGSGDFGIDSITIRSASSLRVHRIIGDWCEFLVGARGLHLQYSKHANRRDASAYPAGATPGHASQSRWRPVTTSEELEPPAAATNHESCRGRSVSALTNAYRRLFSAIPASSFAVNPNTRSARLYSPAK